LGNENSDAGHIKCSRGSHRAGGPQSPHPWVRSFRLHHTNLSKKKSFGANFKLLYW